MVHAKKLAQTLARGIGRCILKSDLHPVLYFAVLFLCLAQTALSLLPPDCMLFALLQWFDLSLHVDSKVLLCILAAPCLAAAGLLLLQNYWAADSERMETTIAQHYAIKIAVTLAFVMSYTLCLTQVRCAVAMLASPSAGDQALGAIVLALFLAVVYPYSMFLLTDLSPQNHKIYAFVNFPNCFTFLNIYRPIAALLVSTNNFDYVIIPTSILFLVLVVGLLKHPIITWQYNKLSQSVIASVIWIILIRILELVSRSEISGLVSLVGFPIFVFFAQWLTHRRLISIISKEQNTVLKLKTLYFLMVNRKQFHSYLSIFLIEHYRACNSTVCSCQSIFQVLRKQKTINEQFNRSEGVNNNNVSNAGASKIGEKSTLSLMNKLKQSTNEKEELKVDHSEKLSSEREKEGVLWFSLMNDLQNDRFDVENLRSLPTTEKNGIISKAKQIVMDEVEVLHYQLDKQYQSLKCVWYNDELEIGNFLSLFYLVRHLIELFKQEQTLQKKSKQDGLNQYALNYHALQTQLIHFKGLLYKTTTQVQSFWVELASQKPDQKKLLRTLEEIIKGRQQISAQRKKVFNKISSDKSDGNEHSWDVKTRVVLEEAFLQFSTALKLNSQTDPYAMNQKELKMLTDNKERTLEKNLELYDYKATTGMAVVNIKPGAQFGLISLSNKSFWELVGCQKYEQANVSHFFIKEMQEYHNNKMLGFLQQNKHTLSLRRGFIVNGCKEILEIEIAAQLLPHLSEGLFVAVFAQEVKSARAIFLLDSSSKILAFNRKFKENFLQRRRLADYDEVITKEVLSRLQDHKESRASLDGEQIHFKLCQTIQGTKTTDQTLFYCEFFQHFKSISIPTKQVFQHPDKSSVSAYKNRNQSLQDYVGGKKIKEQNNVKEKKQKQKQKQFEQKQEMRHFFNILAHGRKSDKLKKWQISMNILLMMSFILSVISSGFGQFKVNNYLATYNSYNNISSIIQHTTEIIYLSRKVNVLSYHNQSERLPAITEKLKQLNELVTHERSSIHTGDWPATLASYQTMLDGKIQITSLTLDMILQKHLLASFTTYLESQDCWNFDYAPSTIRGPYSSCQLSLQSMIENCAYTILPKLSSDFRGFIQEKWKKSILLPTTIIPFCVLMVTLAFIIKIFTIILRLKILQSLDSSMELLSKLKISLIKQKIQSLQGYQENCLQGFQGKQNEKLGIRKNRFNEVNQKNQTIQFSETTSRNFDIVMVSEHQKLAKQNKVQRIQLKIQGTNKRGPLVKVFFTIFPIVLIGIGIVSYQVGQNYLIWGQLELKSLYNSHTESILLINSYTYEFEYERMFFKDMPNSITGSLTDILQNTYSLSHKIESTEAKQSAAYIQKLSNFKKMPLCKIVELVSLQKQSRKCSPEETLSYGDKTNSEILVFYVETARSLFQAYKGLTPTIQMKRKFKNDERHEELNQIRQHLINSGSYIGQLFSAEYKKTLEQYLSGIILMCLSLVPVVVLIKVCWVGKKRKEMQKEVNILKTIVELIGFSQIMRNQWIKKQINNKASVFKFIV